MATDLTPAAVDGPGDRPEPPAATGRPLGVLASMIAPVEPARPTFDLNPQTAAQTPGPPTEGPAAGMSSDAYHHDGDTPTQTTRATAGEKHKQSIWRAWLLAGAARWGKGGGAANKRLDLAKARAQAHQVKEARQVTVNRSTGGPVKPGNASGAGSKGPVGKSNPGGAGNGQKNSGGPDRKNSNGPAKNSPGGAGNSSSGTSAGRSSGQGGPGKNGPAAGKGSDSGSSRTSPAGKDTGSRAPKPQNADRAKPTASTDPKPAPGSAGGKGGAQGPSGASGKAGGTSGTGSAGKDGSSSAANSPQKTSAPGSGTAGGGKNAPSDSSSGAKDTTVKPGTDLSKDPKLPKDGKAGSEGKDPAGGAAPKTGKHDTAKDGTGSKTAEPDPAKAAPQADKKTAAQAADSRGKPFSTRESRETGYRDGTRAARAVAHAKAYRAGVKDGWTDTTEAADREKARLDEAHADRKHARQTAAGDKTVPAAGSSADYHQPTPIGVTGVDKTHVYLGNGANRDSLTRGEVRSLKAFERRLTQRNDTMVRTAEGTKAMQKHAEDQAAKATQLLEQAKGVKGGDKLITSLTRLQEAAQAQAVKAADLHKRALRASEGCGAVLANAETRYGGIYQAVVNSDETAPAELAFYKG